MHKKQRPLRQMNTPTYRSKYIIQNNKRKYVYD